MNKYTRRLIEFFESEKIKYYIDQDYDDSTEDMLTVPAYLSSIPGVIVKIFVSDSGKCSFVAKLGTTESDETKYRLYPVLNDLNNKYSFVSFFIDDNTSVYMTLQFIMTSRLPFDVINEYFGAIVSISSKAAKEILPIIWGIKEEPIEQVEIDEYDFLDDSEDIFEPFSDDEESLSFDGKNESDEVDSMCELFTYDNEDDEDDESDSEDAAS